MEFSCRAAQRLEIQAVQAYSNIEGLQQLHTLPTAIVDYRGLRLSAQGLAPGLEGSDQDAEASPASRYTLGMTYQHMAPYANNGDWVFLLVFSCFVEACCMVWRQDRKSPANADGCWSSWPSLPRLLVCRDMLYWGPTTTGYLCFPRWTLRDCWGQTGGSTYWTCSGLSRPTPISVLKQRRKVR